MTFILALIGGGVGIIALTRLSVEWGAFVRWLRGALQRMQSWQIKRKKEEDASPHCRHDERHDEVKHAEVRAIVSCLHAIADQLTAQKEQQHRQDHKRAPRERITIGALIAAGLFALGSDYLLYRQLADARRAAITQHNDTVDALNLATTTAAAQIEQMTAQATAAATQADAAKSTAETAEQNLIAAQRAWVGPFDAGFDGIPTTGLPPKGQDIGAAVRYSNTGREPGTSFNIMLTHISGAPDNDVGVEAAIGENLRRCVAADTISATQVVYPTAAISGPNEAHVIIPGTEINDDLLSGKKVLFVYGCFTYVSFVKIRHSAFCFFYVSKSQTRPLRLLCRRELRRLKSRSSPQRALRA